MPEFAFIQRHDAATFASLLPPHICCILHRSIYYSDIKLVLGCPGPVWTLFAKVEAWKLCAKVPPENKQQAPSMLFVSNKVVDSPTSLPGTSQLSAVVHPRANVQWIPWKLSKRTAAIDPSDLPQDMILKCLKVLQIRLGQISYLDQNHQLDMIHPYSLSIFRLYSTWLVSHRYAKA